MNLFFNPAQLYPKLVKSTVFIENIKQDGTQEYGAGVFIDSTTIITAAHVVDKANLLRIELDDGKSFTATIKLLDQGRDLAALNLIISPIEATLTNGNRIPKLADLGKAKVGDKVVAIGHPLKFKWSYSFGIISQIRDEVINPGKFILKKALQTDLALNPGNSGGGIFNLQGELLGIASFIASPTGYSDGIAFCNTIPEIQKFLGGN